jgi:hypothetical protein
MATPLEITRTYPVVGPNVVAFAKVNAAGATSAGVRIGEDLAAQASALYQRG